MTFKINISKEEFIKKLSANTKNSNPFLFASPLGIIHFLMKGKPFIGYVNDHNFIITRLDDVLPYSWYLDGKLNQDDENVELEVHTRLFVFPIIFEIIGVLGFVFALTLITIIDPNISILTIPIILLILFSIIWLERFARKSLLKYFIDLMKLKMTIPVN